MQRILAIQIKRIGDLILTAPALARLRQARPDARITLVTMGAAGELVPAIPAVDEHFSYRYRRPNLALWADLALSNYDVALDFNGLDRSRLMTGMSRAAIRATYEKRARGIWGDILYTHVSQAPLRRFHTVDHMLALLDVLDLPPSSGAAPASMTVPETVRLHTDRLLAGRGVDGPFAVVHPGTARPEKYWLPERWAGVIDAVAAGPDGLPCVITGGSDAAERQHIGAILAATRQRPIVLAGELSLLETAAVIQRATMALGVDTAAMHLAAAFQRPQVTLFGPTNPYHWRPWNPEGRVVVPGDSGPLDESRLDPEAPGAAMSDILTSQVLSAIATLRPGA